MPGSSPSNITQRERPVSSDGLQSSSTSRKAATSKTCLVTYSTLQELRDALTLRFQELECVFGTYELVKRCPTFLLAPK